MSKILDHVENARKSALGDSLNSIHQQLVKFRLFGLHMIDALDKRLVAKFDALADDIEAEIRRLNGLEAEKIADVPAPTAIESEPKSE